MNLGAAQPLLDALDGVAYVSDITGRVIAVGRRNWDDFACANGAMSSGEVVGRNLFSAIRGGAVREAYAAVHRAVLSGERPWVSFEYRCDGPDLARRMRMSLSRLEGEGGQPRILHQSQVLSITARPWMSLFEPERIVEAMKADSNFPLVTLCGFCQRVSWPCPPAPAEWIAPETYYRRGGAADVRISHGVCPQCVSRL